MIVSEGVPAEGWHLEGHLLNALASNIFQSGLYLMVKLY